MSHSIAKDFDFSAAHYLTGLPEGHQCAKIHGHNYIVRVAIGTDKLDEVGFVIDYGELNWFKEDVIARYDHTLLNDELPFNPTAENMAEFFGGVVYHWLMSLDDKRVFSIDIGVSETPKTWACYHCETVHDA